MPAIGITGGISTGKSTFCECLKKLLPDAKIFDADEAAHQLVNLEEVKQELLKDFGFSVFSPNGDLNRAALRAIVFQDAAKKRALEQILHPRIRRQWQAEAETHRKSHEFFFADIPLLYETGGETLCDRVVVVACSPTGQLNRLNERLRGIGLRALETGPLSDHRLEADAAAMINSQMPLDEKIKRADHVVWNNGPRGLLAEEAANLVALWRIQQWTKV